VKGSKRRNEMKHIKDRPDLLNSQPVRPAPLKNGAERALVSLPIESVAPLSTVKAEELVAEHELAMLHENFDSETFRGTHPPAEPHARGEESNAEEELWRRLSNTAWIRERPSETNDGNGSTITQRP
jgi:hypothetical protein